MFGRIVRIRPVAAFGLALSLTGAAAPDAGTMQIWLLHMPELERFQREHPDNPLYTSEWWDERIPPGMAIDPAFDPARPSMFRDLLACRPAAILVDLQLRRNGTDMPVRFYVTVPGGDSRIADCIRRTLPHGYVLRRVASDRGEPNSL